MSAHKRAKISKHKELAKHEEKELDGSCDRLLQEMIKVSASKITSQPRFISGILHCSMSDTLPLVLRRLSENNISSMPVTSRTGKFMNRFVDLWDLVKFIASTFVDFHFRNFEEFSPFFQSQEINSWKHAQLWSLGLEESVPILETYSLFFAMEVLARKNQARVAIIDVNDRVTRILSRSGAIQFCYQNLAQIKPEVTQLDVASLNLRPGPPLAINENQRPITAFKMISDHGVESVAVVNNNGEFLGDFSVKDLKNVDWNCERFYGLYGSVRAFKGFTSYPKLDDPCRVKLNDTLGHILTVFGKNQSLRRCWVIDEKNIAIKCITMRDILLNLLNPPTSTALSA